jgi:hypothetical protein
MTCDKQASTGVAKAVFAGKNNESKMVPSLAKHPHIFLGYWFIPVNNTVTASKVISI